MPNYRALLLIGLMVLSGTAQALTITRGMSGAWYDPNNPGQGLFVEVIDSAQGKEVVVAWFAFDPNGSPHWLVGSGLPLSDTVALSLYQRGVGVFAAPGPAEPPLQAWGTASLSFTSCDRASLRYSASLPGYGSGEVALTRLTRLYGASCTGTPLDDGPTNVASQSAYGDLLPVQSGAPFHGELHFSSTAGKVQFEVTAEGLPLGPYQVLVGGIARGSLFVVASGQSTRGRIEFQSPPDNDKPLLDFEPLNRTVEIVSASGPWLRGQLGPLQASTPALPVSNNAPPVGNANAVLHLTATAGGEAKAELRQEPERVKFEVEAEAVPAGPLLLSVDGQARAQFEVLAVAGRLRGEVEFQSPPDNGKLTLDFDPRGKRIELSRAGSVLFSGLMPTTPNELPGQGSTPVTPGGSPLSFEQFMTNTGLDGDARARLRFERRADRTRFDVELEDLADGPYRLIVGGSWRADINVVAGEGEVEFSNPSEPGKPLLDFDPLGQSVRIDRDGRSYFLATVHAP